MFEMIVVCGYNAASHSLGVALHSGSGGLCRGRKPQVGGRRGLRAWGRREDWEGFCERVPGNRSMVQISGHPPRILCSHMERKQRYRKFRLELPAWEAGLHGDFSAGTLFGVGTAVFVHAK